MPIRYEITNGALPVTVYLMQGVTVIDSNIHNTYEEGQFDILYGEYELYLEDSMGCNATEWLYTTTTTLHPPTTTTTSSSTTTTSTSSTTTTSTTSEPTTTTTSTTILQYRAAMYVGPSAPDMTTETVIPYSENTQIILNSPTLEGINYFFISIPQGKTLNVYDMFMANITSEFEYHSDQQLEGYYDNTLYRKRDVYDTTGSTTFYLIIT